MNKAKHREEKEKEVLMSKTRAKEMLKIMNKPKNGENFELEIKENCHKTLEEGLLISNNDNKEAENIFITL